MSANVFCPYNTIQASHHDAEHGLIENCLQDKNGTKLRKSTCISPSLAVSFFSSFISILSWQMREFARRAGDMQDKNGTKLRKGTCVLRSLAVSFFSNLMSILS